MFAQTIPIKSKSRKPAAAQIKRNLARWNRVDEQIIKRNIEANEQTIRGLIELVAKNPYLESLIITNYCDRTNQYLVDATKYDNQYHIPKGGKNV